MTISGDRSRPSIKDPGKSAQSTALKSVTRSYRIGNFYKIANLEVRWNAQSLKEIRGAPWKPNPDVDDPEVHCQVRVPNESGPITQSARGFDGEPEPRRLRLNPEIVKGLGLKMNCPGCRAIRDKKTPQ